MPGKIIVRRKYTLHDCKDNNLCIHAGITWNDLKSSVWVELANATNRLYLGDLVSLLEHLQNIQHIVPCYEVFSMR